MKHLYWIDFAKTFGLLLMILGHGNLVNNDLQCYIYSFHMPMFFIISGLLTRNIRGGGSRFFNKYQKTL